MTSPPSSPSTTTTPTTTSFTTTTAGRGLALQDSSCEVGLDLQDCKANEECVPVQDKSRNGLCKCKEGFSRINNICTSGKLPLTSIILPYETWQSLKSFLWTTKHISY
jgi:hypothetical protein